MPARLRVCLQEVGGWRVVCLVVCAAPFDTFVAWLVCSFWDMSVRRACLV